MIPIGNAKDVKLNQLAGDVPQMGEALLSWFQPMRFVVLTKHVINFQNVEQILSVDFRGVWQPTSARQLAMKPEGQRSWKWYTVHADPSLDLNNDDIIVYLNKPYRVMGKWDWKLYGFNEFHLVEDYKADVSKILTQDDEVIDTQDEESITL